MKKIIVTIEGSNQKLKVPLYLKRKIKTRYVVPFKGRDNASGVIWIKKWINWLFTFFFNHNLL